MKWQLYWFLTRRVKGPNEAHFYPISESIFFPFTTAMSSGFVSILIIEAFYYTYS